MSMSMTELEQALRALRLSGMIATLQARALQVAHHQMDFTEAFASLVQDELDRRRSRLLERRFTLSGLPERKDLKDFDWSYNPRIPKRDVLELATLKFVEAREGALFLGDARVINDLQQKIAKLVLEISQIVARDRIGNLVGFLDRVRRDRFEGLLKIPRATGNGRA